ncbi:MAG: rhodanese-like domain-containing protein, partial [Vicinamibacterales bacterium]
MRELRTVLLAAVLAAATIFPARAAETRDALLVSPAWLAQHQADANLVLLHVGLKPEYDAGHIAGARYLNYTELAVSDRTPGGLTLQMLPAEDLRQRLAAAGISNTSRIVIYFAHENAYVSPSARVIFTLDYAGLGDQVSLLDGGLDAWTGTGHATTTEVPVAKAGTLAPLTIRPIIADAEFVRANLASPNVSIVDARNAAFYSGAQTGGNPSGPHKTGHIAGAKSVPFSETVDEANVLKPAAVLQKLFADAGVKPGDTVVAYCHIGQQATQVILAARTLGFKVMLYDGSFEEWSRKDYPVEKN